MTFKLTEQFLEKYHNKQPEWGYGIFSYITFKRTYSRPMEDGKTEEWFDVVKRVVEGCFSSQKEHCEKLNLIWDARKAQKSAQEMFERIFGFKMLPPGRSLWAMGTDALKKKGSAILNNCFAFDTEIITRDGIKKIGELNGKTVKLLTSGMKWVEAPILSFGKQQIVELKVVRSGVEKIIKTTADHEWFVVDRRSVYRNKGWIKVKTKDLKLNKHRLRYSFGQSMLGLTEPSYLGIAHGFTFGDGTLHTYPDADNSVVFCAEKDKALEKYFSTFRRDNSGRVKGIPNFFKSLPSITENKAYLLGWLMGYFAADGCCDKNGTVEITSFKKENILYIRSLCSVLGIGTNSILTETKISNLTHKQCTAYSISLMPSTLTKDFFIIEQHKLNFTSDKNKRFWTVKDIKYTSNIEEVFCATVDKYHCFTLADNILTSNCAYTSTENIHHDFTAPFCWFLDLLCLGVGVGGDTKGAGKVVIKQPKEKTCSKFIIPDTREGWVEALRLTLKAFEDGSEIPEYDYSLIRPIGAPIKTFGGLSSGHEPLKTLLENVRTLLSKRINEKITSVDIVDIFNFIGKCAVAGNVRRCLPFDARVQTYDGFKEIKDIIVGDLVSTNNGWKKVLNTFQQGKQQTIILKHQDGEFECTPNHKVAILSNTDTFFWKYAKDVVKNDRLLFIRNKSIGHKTQLPPWEYNKPNHSTTCVDINIPELDTDTAWLLGIFQTDGYTYTNFGNNGFNAYVSFVFSLNELKIAEKTKICLEKFGVQNVVLKNRKNENSYIVSCQSKQLAWYLANFKKAKTEIRIPECIINGLPNIKLAYLSGVIDGDGAVRNKPKIICSSIYKEFIKDLQALCMSLGFETRISFYKKDKCLSRKSNWCQIYTLSCITLNSQKNIFNNPFIVKDCIIGKKSSFGNSFPKEFFSKKLQKDINIDNYEKTVKLTNIVPIKISSIENGRLIDTYDIEVADNHNFMCQNVLTHNSAEIILGNLNDEEFIDCKNPNKYSQELLDRRWASNNSIYAEQGMDYSKFIKPISEAGEPGFFWLGNAKAYGRFKDGKDFKDSNVQGLNPCLPVWATVLTPTGISTIEKINIGDTIWSGKRWTKVVRKFKTGIKPVNAYETTAGTLYCTDNHRVLNKGVKIEVGKTDAIDICVGPKVNKISYNKIAIIDGLLVGDGMVHKASNNLSLLCIGADDKDYHNSEISHLIGDYRPGIHDGAWEIKQHTYTPIAKTYDRFVPDNYKYGNLKDKISFLRGLYSANGSIVKERITLKAVSLQIIKDVQIMLSSIGIKSYFTTNKAQNVKFNNGTYTCKQSYDLNITTDRGQFKDLIGFIQKYKTIKLNNICKTIKINGKQTFNIKSIKNVSTEEVWDIEVDAIEHTFWCNGLLISNCGEIALESYELCNLVNVYPSHHDNEEDFEETLKYAYLFAKTVSLIPTHDPKINNVVAKNRRIGLSLGGVEQAKKKFGTHRFYNNFCDKGYVSLKHWDKIYSDWLGVPRSIKITTEKPDGTTALLAGVTPGIHAAHSEYYYRTIRLAHNSPLLKPLINAGYRVEYGVTEWKEGLIFDTSKAFMDISPSNFCSKEYEWFNKADCSNEEDNCFCAENYVPKDKWTHFAMHSPIYDYHNQPIKNFEGTLIVYFPIKEKNFNGGKDNYSIWEQFENAAKMQYYWSDNAVSVTITFKENEIKDLKNVLEHYESRLKSVSLLPLKDHKYLQAPYITIDKDVYNKEVAKLKPIQLLEVSQGDKKEDKYCDGDKCQL